jgi:hypothetical protein
MEKQNIIQIKGEVQLLKRNWWQLYKFGWHRHRDFWGGLWWIRFKWPQENNLLK